MKFDLNFSPKSYINDLSLEQKLGSKIKGEIRGQFVKSNIKDNFIPPQLLTKDLSETVKTGLGSVHPWMMGGEYLPTLSENEVEICRVVLKSATLDIISFRAMCETNTIKYRVVDEYEGDFVYNLEKDKSSSPLSMGELIKMIDTCERENADGDPLEKGLVKPFAIASGLDFVSVHSAFYNELEQYYEYEKSKWASEAT